MMQCDEQSLKLLLIADDDSTSLDEQRLTRVAEHVDTCPACQEKLETLAGSHDQWREASHWLGVAAENAAVIDPAPTRSRVLPQRTSWHPRTTPTESMIEGLLAEPSHPEMLGRLGRYEIERLVGSGGMGIVFKAYDTELARHVAIKMLAPHLASNGAARQRFAREARAAAAVVDEHVVSIHNVEPNGDLPYLVMKYIGGGSLQERLDRDGPLQVCEVLRIGMQTAKGLAAAHAQGLIHRDVKPSNILLDEGVDRALLTDFGLARAGDDASLTRTGQQPGTPNFMSPEQVWGRTIDVRSDLFSLGAVLYTMLTGRTPFRADSTYAVLRRITDVEPTSLRQLNVETPEWMNELVMKLLAKSPDERFDSANEVAELLERYLAHVQNPNVSPPIAHATHSATKRSTADGRHPSAPRNQSGLLLVGGIVSIVLFAIVLAASFLPGMRLPREHQPGPGTNQRRENQTRVGQVAAGPLAPTPSAANSNAKSPETASDESNDDGTETNRTAGADNRQPDNSAADNSEAVTDGDTQKLDPRLQWRHLDEAFEQYDRSLEQFELEPLDSWQ